jgi:hypothetical protein
LLGQDTGISTGFGVFLFYLIGGKSPDPPDGIWVFKMSEKSGSDRNRPIFSEVVISPDLTGWDPVFIGQKSPDISPSYR